MSVKVLIEDPNGHFLLLRRALTSGGNPGKWELPGGKVDPGEELGEAIRREVFEETGLVVKPGSVAGHTESIFEDRRIIYLVMFAELTGSESGGTSAVTLSEEHDEFSWVDPGSVLDLDLAHQYRKFFDTFRA